MAQRYSKKREAIYNAIRSTDTHPSAEWVYEKLKPEYPDLSLATVYRNISEFRAEGLLRSVGSVDFHERYDAELTPHAHFICTKCGSVTDIPFDFAGIDLSAGDVGTAESAEVTFRGICKNCAEAHFDK